MQETGLHPDSTMNRPRFMSAPAHPGTVSTFTWISQDGRRRVYLNLDAVERLSVDVMRAFASVPKRGAEVGGILLGRVIAGSEPGIAVDDFFEIPCRHEFGPAYLLSDSELSLFAERVAGRRGEASVPLGYYRSHTREGLELGVEDQELLARCFGGRPHLVLLVKPTSTRLSTGAFCFEFEAGLTPAAPHFPFRRKDLESAVLRPLPVPDPTPSPEEPVAVATPELPAPRRGTPRWLWSVVVTLSMLTGVALGFFVAQTLASSQAVLEQERFYTLGLSVAKSGENLSVRWDRQSKPILAASRGTLAIEDGPRRTELEMNVVQLQGGSLLYRPSAKKVRFRLEVLLKGTSRLHEYVDWP